MRYGLPYKGSKNGIAEWIVSELPRAEVFCDLFFGGGAITHAGMLSGKWKRFIVNDIDARLPKLFIECAWGKHTVENHPEWISKEEFEKRKADNLFISLVWSFGNNGVDYLYAKDKEPFKKALHYAVIFDDFSLLRVFGINISRLNETKPYARITEIKKAISKQEDRLESMERLQHLESLQRLQRLRSLQSLQSYGVDYQEVPIPKGALIYCDIPYCGTQCGKYDGFDHNRFYEWAEKQDNIYISEYTMPDAFIPIAKREKVILSSADGNGQKAEEIIFTNKRTYEKLDSTTKERIGWNLAEQLTLF